MRIMITLLLAVLAMPALAVTLSWEPPTTRVSGEELQASEVGNYEICVSAEEGGECVETLTASSGEVQMPVDTVLSDYKPRHFRIRVYDTDGLVSEWSDSVRAKIVGPPTAPTLKILNDG